MSKAWANLRRRRTAVLTTLGSILAHGTPARYRGLFTNVCLWRRRRIHTAVLVLFVLGWACVRFQPFIGVWFLSVNTWNERSNCARSTEGAAFPGQSVYVRKRDGVCP